MTDELFFADEAPTPQRYQSLPWKLLVVDDEPEVHNVTKLALSGFQFGGRGLEFLHAYSGVEAKALLRNTPDVALVLLDVVMESDHAGLEVVEYIRNELGNRFVRLVLRTGQPGQAPEHEVITRYDINDYKHKTELTRERLFSTVYTGLSVYRDLRALDANRMGLEKVIEASAHIFELHSAETFTQGVLEQLSALLFFNRDALMIQAEGIAATEGKDPSRLTILAATGRFSEQIGKRADESLPPVVLQRIRETLESRQSVMADDYYVGVHALQPDMVFYVGADTAISLPDRRIIDMFNRNVAIAHHNLLLIAKRHSAPEAT